MVYRKWSLLTGPAAILGGIVATAVVANYIFVEHIIYGLNYTVIFLHLWDPFHKQEQKQTDAQPLAK